MDVKKVFLIPMCGLSQIFVWFRLGVTCTIENRNVYLDFMSDVIILSFLLLSSIFSIFSLCLFPKIRILDFFSFDFGKLSIEFTKLIKNKMKFHFYFDLAKITIYVENEQPLALRKFPLDEARIRQLQSMKILILEEMRTHR